MRDVRKVKQPSEMTLRELINSTAQDEEHIGVDGLSPWKVIDELERRLDEIEAAIASVNTDLFMEDLGRLDRNSDYRDAYRAARDARSGK